MTVKIKREQLVNMNQHYKRFSIDYFLDCTKKVGYKNIELWTGASHYFVDANSFEDPKPLKNKLKDRGLKIVTVTTASVAYQYQYASQEKETLERSFRYFSNGIRLASEFEATKAIVNSGWGYINEDFEEMWKRLRENLYNLTLIAEKYGVTLVMESLRPDETNIINSLPRAKRMFDEINHPNFKVMVDSIATGISGESLEDWFKVFGNNLKHMHYLDGNPYDHNIWGDGNTPLEKEIMVMQKYGYDGYLTQEVADDKYFSNPFEADVKNMRTLERFIE